MSAFSRSTKAGAKTPATPPPHQVTADDAPIAQRRPGPKPRRHKLTRLRSPLSASAQRRPGPKPRRHSCQLSLALVTRPPLNEGRGQNPGDTRAKSRRLWPFTIAQRRPGPKPRRHAFRGWGTPGIRPALNEGRGQNPGDTNCQRQVWAMVGSAQRRPGPKPRRHT